MSKVRRVLKKQSAEDFLWIRFAAIGIATGISLGVLYTHYKNRSRLIETCQSYYKAIETQSTNKSAIINKDELNSKLRTLSYVNLRLLASDPTLLYRVIYKIKNVV